MKSRFALFLFTVCLIAPVAALAEVDNLNKTSSLIDEGIEPAPAPKTILDGIPLFQGLQTDGDMDPVEVLPSAADKSIVTVGIVDVDDVYNFYKRTLPPLGWTATSSRDYAKGNEVLHINAQANGKMSTVTFTEKIVN